MILKFSHKVLNKMEQSDVFRFAVLSVVAVNFVGVVIIPPINYLLGGPDTAQFYPYVDLIWTVLLAALLVHYVKHSNPSSKKYFDNKVPALLIAAYFITIVIIFILKTIGFPITFRLATELASYDIEMMRMYIWAPVSYLLSAWQINMLYIIGRNELITKSNLKA